MIIRQEVNIVTNGSTSNTNATITMSELVYLDTTKYSGSVSYYFEVIADATAGSTGNVRLRRNGTTTDDATIAISSIGATLSLTRSSSFTPNPGGQEYFIFIDAAGVGKQFAIIGARIVVIQDTGASSLTATETQIDLGSHASAFQLATQTSPKYFKYDSANWDGTLTVFFEAVLSSPLSTKITATATLQIADGTGDGFVGWANVTNGSVTTTSASVTRVRSIALTLTAGRNYRIVVSSSNSKSAVTIHNARLVIDQVDGYVDSSITSITFFGGTASSGEGTQALGQSFKIASTSTVTGVRLKLAKTASPVDNISVNITTSIGGTSVASATLSGSSLTTSAANYTVTFSSPVVLTGGTTYFIQLTRSGIRDATNNYIWYQTNDQTIYADGTNYSRDSNVWSAVNSGDFSFLLIGHVGITKLETQYFIGTAISGTGLQTFLTKWDSTEWSGVDNTYKFAVDAGDNSTSVVALMTSDGVTTVGTVTSPDNQGISAALTMPSNQNLDVKATTNNGDVYAAKILVQVVKSVVSTPPYLGGSTMMFLGVGLMSS